MHVRRLVVAGVELDLVEVSDVDALLEDAIERGGIAPYGAVLWSSGVVVAARCAARDLRGLRVLELGAGTGIVSLLCSKRGAHVHATDVDEVALALVRAAAAGQGLTLETSAFDILGPASLPPADVVVAADLLYEPALAAALARRVIEALARGSACIVGDPGRTFRAGFERALTLAGLAPHFVRHATSLAGDRPAHDAAHEADVLEVGPARASTVH